MVRVEGVRLERRSEGHVLSGRIDGQEATFKFSRGAEVTARGEPFLALALLRAMAAGEPLNFDDTAPLDPELVSRLPKVQTLLRLWNPNFSVISIACRQEAAPRLLAGAMSSFSGGVDSACTLADHLEEIQTLLTIDCFDAGVDSDADTERLEAKVADLAAALGKTSIFVRTNIRTLATRFGMGWTYAHGPVLCLLATSLGPERFYMPSSDAYLKIKPWGSHPMLDPLWGTTSTQIEYDGGYHLRTEKTEIISRNPILLSQLQVCWNSQVQNCGHCSKCARTLIVLNTLKVENAPFKPAQSRGLVSKLRLDSDLAAMFAHDVAVFLERHGEMDLARRLHRRLQQAGLRHSLKQVRRRLLGRSLVDAYRRWRGRHHPAETISITDPDDWF